MHPIEVNLPLASPMSTFSNSLYRAHDLPRVKSLFQPSSELEVQKTYTGSEYSELRDQGKAGDHENTAGHAQ